MAYVIAAQDRVVPEAVPMAPIHLREHLGQGHEFHRVHQSHGHDCGAYFYAIRESRLTTPERGELGC